jgi:hypothetical protein
VLLSWKLSHLCRSEAVPFNLEERTSVREGGRRHAVLLQTCKLLCCLDCPRGEDVWARESHWWVLVRGARLRLSDPSGDLLIRRCLLGEPGWGCVSGVSDRGVFHLCEVLAEDCQTDVVWFSERRRTERTSGRSN